MVATGEAIENGSPDNPSVRVGFRVGLSVTLQMEVSDILDVPVTDEYLLMSIHEWNHMVTVLNRETKISFIVPYQAICDASCH